MHRCTDANVRNVAMFSTQTKLQEQGRAVKKARVVNGGLLCLMTNQEDGQIKNIWTLTMIQGIMNTKDNTK